MRLKKQKQRKYHWPPKIPLKCGLFHLYLFCCSWQPTVQMKHVKLAWRPERRRFCVQQPKNLWPCFYHNIPLFLFCFVFFSVFISCTVLLHFASTVIIKWWLSSPVTFPGHCSCAEFYRRRLKSHAYLGSLFGLCRSEEGLRDGGRLSRGGSRAPAGNLCLFVCFVFFF